MKIGEAAERTGLSISNIRFYEKKGLLTPDRDKQSQYRDYTEEDVKRLKQIVLYRKMDISIETIDLLLQGKTTLEQALKQQVQLLKTKQECLQASMDLCEEILHRSADAPMDVDYYLHYVKNEEEKGRKFAEIEELLADFASYTRFDLWTADPALRFFFRDAGRLRIARVLWAVALMVILPAVILVDNVMDSAGMSPQKLLFWICMLVILWGPFISFWMKNRK